MAKGQLRGNKEAKTEGDREKRFGVRIQEVAGQDRPIPKPAAGQEILNGFDP